MEFFEAINIEEFVKTFTPNFDAQQRIFSQILEALMYLHENHIFHGDFNLTNVLINVPSYQIKIIDFGLSKLEINGDCMSPAQGNQKYRLPGKIFQTRTIRDLWGASLIFLSILLKKKMKTKSVLDMIETIKGNQKVEKMLMFLKEVISKEDLHNPNVYAYFQF